MKTNDFGFWVSLEEIIKSSSILIDRPKGTAHPRYSSFIYPVDYGYLEGTTSMDGGGIDVWRGTGNNGFDSILCVVDEIKKDSEIKILINCSEKEKQEILKCQNFGKMKAILIYKFNED